MKIYKYSPLNKNTLENLKNSGLWFSTTFIDDEMDNNLPIGEFQEEEFYKTSIEFFNNNPELYKRYSEIFKENQISKSSNQDFSIEEMMSTLKRTFHGISCFTTTDSSEYMWRKFANNNFGFCLCFDTEYDSFFFKELYDVSYKTELPTVNLMNDNLAKQMEIYSLTKRKKYIEEDEQRLFKHSTGLHKYKRESLREIRLGKFFKDPESFENMINKYYKHDILIKKNVT